MGSFSGTGSRAEPRIFARDKPLPKDFAICGARDYNL